MSEDFVTLGQLVDRNAEKYPHNLALVCNKKRMTYGRLKTEVDAFAKGLLAFGISKGDRVALLMHNRLEWIVVSFALVKIGAILIPINIRYRRHELEYILSHCKPLLLILEDRYNEVNFVELLIQFCPELHDAEKEKLRLNKLPSLKYIICLSDHKYQEMFGYDEVMKLGKERENDHFIAIQKMVNCEDIAYIIYTSGTTSFPKGVILTHSNICLSGQNISKRMHTKPDDKLWVPIPLFFSFGCVNAVITAFSKGACLVLQEYFEPKEGLKLIEKERCTILYGVPSIYLKMLDHPGLKESDVSSLRRGCIMGSPEYIRRVAEEMGVSQVTSGYGMTETSALSAMTDVSDPIEVRINTAGHPLPGVTILIKDPKTRKVLPLGEEGEICVKGYNVMRGYYNNPEKTKKAFDKDGFLKTGDSGLICEQGYLRFCGRIKEMLKTSGINVSPLEVENFIKTHPAVEDAYVVGIPDKVKEEVGFAFVKLSKDLRCSEEDIFNYCEGEIASYKIPKYIRFIDNFPVTGSGKVKKFKLRELAMSEL